MSILAASLKDRGVKLADDKLIADCEGIIRELGIRPDEFVDAADAALMSSSAPSLNATAIEGVRQNLLKKAAKGGFAKSAMKTPAPQKYDRTNIGSMPGFSAASMPTQTPVGQTAGAKRPYDSMTNSSAPGTAGRPAGPGGFSATSSAAAPRPGGGPSFSSPPPAGGPAAAARPGAAPRPAGAGAPAASTPAPGRATNADAYNGRKNAGEVVDTFQMSGAGSISSSSSSPGASSSSSSALPDALAAAAMKPHTRHSIATLRALGFKTFKNVGELVKGAGGGRAGRGGAADGSLSATEPFPLVVSSVTRWAEVTGMRVGLPPIPPPPPVLEADAAPAPSGGASSPGAAASSPGAKSSPGGGGASASSSSPSGGAGASAGSPAVDGLEGGGMALDEDDGEDAGAPDSRRFEVPANRNVEEPFKYMFTTLEKRAAALEGRLEEVGDAIITANSLEGLLEPVGTVSQSPLVYVGRVCVDGEGKINATSVLLEGSSQDPIPGGLANRNPHMRAGRIALDLRDVPAFSLFPGQIIAVRGVNSTGEKMVVQAVYTGAPPPPAVSPAENVKAVADACGSSPDKGGPLRIAVAAGPFTLASDWAMAPLNDLMLALAQGGRAAAPDVLVLMGPFVDADHPTIKSGGDVLVENEAGTGQIPLAYHDVWSGLVAPAIEEGLQLEALRRTQLVLLPSASDITCHPTFPQWPLQAASHLSAFADPDVRRRVSVVPNPATFVVGGVVVGGTSTDVLFQLNANDTTRNSTAPGAPRVEKILRMAQHLLEQRSFYPLFPAPDPVDTPLEMTQLHMAGMALAPDLLLLPSKLRQFSRALPNGTLVVNPGSLCRANSGGTFARISLFPPTRGAMKTQDVPQSVIDTGDLAEGEPTSYAFHSIPERTRVEIVRV